MMNIYLLRHGKTLGKPALNGHTDVGVEELIQQDIAKTLLNRFTFTKIYTSPLQRCHRVAELLTESKPALKLVIDERLKEQNFGEFDGVPFDDLQHEWRTLEQFWADPARWTLPSAEPLQAGYDRVIDAWTQIVQHCEQDTLIIAHGGPIRYIVSHVLGLDWQNPLLYTGLSVANQSVTHLQIDKYDEQVFVTVKSISIPLTLFG